MPDEERGGNATDSGHTDVSGGSTTTRAGPPRDVGAMTDAAMTDAGPVTAVAGAPLRLVLRVLLPFAAFAAAWVLVVGPLVEARVDGALAAWEPWLFLLASLALLFLLFRREDRARTRSEQTLSATLSAVPDAVAILREEDGTLVEANEGFGRFGYERSDLLGRSLEEVGVWRAGETRRLQLRLRSSERVQDLETAFLTKEGEPRTVVLSARSVNGRGARTVLVVRDVTEERAFRARSAWQVLHDPLTGLPNRDLLLDRLDQGLRRARRRETRVAVLALNVDRFRVVNESLGHEIGDRLLRAIAQRLSASLRREDTVARPRYPVGSSETTVGRLGGDEFTVVLEGIHSVEAVRIVLDRARRATTDPFELDGETVTITACIGGAVSPVGGDSEATELLRQAAIALRRAKEKGLGREHLFDATVDSRAVRRLRLEGDLRAALDRGDLELHYQPIVFLADGRIAGFESLMRWKHEELGFVSPLEIIPIAEESGLIVELGGWVLGEACRQAAEWNRRLQDLGPLSVAVNVSAREIQETSFLEVVDEALRESGLPPGRLELEVTEGLMMQSLLGLRRLKQLEVRVAIDDFGTGYSSLAYLSRLPVDAIKIDRSFVEELGVDEESTALGRAMVAMAESLGLETIAEGIETEEQLAAVRELGCTFGQGYLFSRPLRAERLEALLVEEPRW